VLLQQETEDDLFGVTKLLQQLLSPDQDDMDALMDGPAGVPPAGVVPNLNHPDNKNGLALFVIVFCSVVSTICILLRAYGKCVLLKSFKAEEALIFSAYVSAPHHWFLFELP